MRNNAHIGAWIATTYLGIQRRPHPRPPLLTSAQQQRQSQHGEAHDEEDQTEATMSRALKPMRPSSGKLQNGWYMLPSMLPYATAIVILP